MSLDLLLRSPRRTSLKRVESVLFPLGWAKGNHLLFDSKGSYVWFHQADFQSTRGAWIFVRAAEDTDPAGTKTVFHGYSNAGRSFEDLEALNSGIRVLRRHFGGSVYDPQRGVTGYLVNDIPRLSPQEKACGLVYLSFQSNLARGLFLAVKIDDEARKRIEVLGDLAFERGLLTNNLVLPFLVASFEAFLKGFFVAYVDMHPLMRDRVFRNRKRFDADVVQALISKSTTLGKTEAANYTFQNLSSANAAFTTYLEVDLFRIWRRRRRFKGRYHIIGNAVQELLDKRHRLIHEAELDLAIDHLDVERYAFFLRAAAQALVAHLQEERQFRTDLHELL